MRLTVIVFLVVTQLDNLEKQELYGKDTLRFFVVGGRSRTKHFVTTVECLSKIQVTLAKVDKGYVRHISK